MKGSVFVARERELERLDGFLGRVLAGQGQVVFVTGEAGSGKTTLVTEFARRAQEQHSNLIVAVGQSDAQTGVGDAYLPFREVLGQLTGDVEGKVARETISQENVSRLRKLMVLSGQALVEVGPDLIGILVPGAGLVTRVGAFAAEKVGWLEKLEQLAGRPRGSEGPSSTGIEQDHIFEQYTNVLNALAEKQPLLLVLDDLQWADAASIGLLFRLGRRIGGSRILLVGTYRPEEVALGRPLASSGQVERHPLEKVLAELKRYFGDIGVDMDQAEEAEGQQFVAAFLDTEPHCLGEGFCKLLYRHTGGHPLFTIELLRAMQERGDLVQDEQGRWVTGASLNWAALPARVEGVIEERIGRLAEDLREILTVSSVEGEDFTAEVVARVQAADARELVKRLNRELEKQHRLVRARGIRRLAPDGQRLSLYRFQHNLFQTYLYNGLNEVERAVLHEDVGNALEGLYGDSVDEIAVQLARHFVQAGIAEKARPYLRRAGEQAAARFANDEAVTYLSRAIELTPDTNAAERYDLLLARERVYDVQGARESQSHDLAALRELAESLDDDRQLAARRQAIVALRQAHYAEVIGDFPAAIAVAQAAISHAQSGEAIGLEAMGCLQWGQALWHQGEYEEARTQLECALAQGQAAGTEGVVVDSLRGLGLVANDLGDYAGALAYFEKSRCIAHKIGDRRGESKCLNNMGVVARRQGEYETARTHYERALAVFREAGDRIGEGACLNNLGLVAHDLGDYARAGAYFEQSLGIARQIGDRQVASKCLNNLGNVAQCQGDLVGSRIYYEEALGIDREIGDRGGEGIRLLNLGLSYCQQDDYSTAWEYNRQAVDIAQELGNRLTEGYALASLGHSLVGLGRLTEAAEAYQQALELWQDAGQREKAMEPLAGLAWVSMAQGDLAPAKANVEEILHHMATGTLDGTLEPFRIYLTCYRVLQANRDPRAGELLDMAHNLLQERAAKIGDEDLRHSFLENMANHREILKEVTKSQQSTGQTRE
jgi:adenylate cyclase